MLYLLMSIYVRIFRPTYTYIAYDIQLYLYIYICIYILYIMRIFISAKPGDISLIPVWSKICMNIN